MNAQSETSLHIQRKFGKHIIVKCVNYTEALNLANTLVKLAPDRDPTFPKYRKTPHPSALETVHVTPSLHFILSQQPFPPRPNASESQYIVMSPEEAYVLFLKPDADILSEPTKYENVHKLSTEAKKTAIMEYTTMMVLDKEAQKKHSIAERPVKADAKTRIWVSRIWDSNDFLIDCANRTTGYDLAYKILLTHELLNRDMSGHIIYMRSNDVNTNPYESQLIASTAQIQIAFLSGIDLPDLANWTATGHKCWDSSAKPYILLTFEEAEMQLANPRRYPLLLKKFTIFPTVKTPNPQILKLGESVQTRPALPKN